MLWTVKQASMFLGIEFHQMYYLLYMGYVEAFKIGKAWRVMPDSVIEYAGKHKA